MKITLSTLVLPLFLLAGCAGPKEKGDARPQVQPYGLDTCIITESKLGSMGDPITKVYGNREVKFCCAPCVEEFEMDIEGYLEDVDEAIENAEAK
ncbi:MAG: hypothetical protein ACI841_003495 [Planctomycetota bacterium]|jgi:hypothetical protein